jgi:hypothetical protein
MKKNILILFTVVLIIFCMIILSGYEKAMSGVFGMDDSASYEIYESEEDVISSVAAISVHRKDEQEKNLKHYKKRKRHRFLGSVFRLIGKSQKVPFKPIKPDLKRSPLPKRREPVKTLPSQENASFAFAKKEVLLQTAFGNVIKKDEVNKLLVKGNSVGGQYYDNIIIEIYDLSGVLLNIIRPKTNSGYNPNILLGDFAGNGLKQIFLGINSGGSGGFGYFYVFDAQNNEIKTLFDYEEFSQNNQYSGEYINNYKAKVTKKGAKESYIIDLSLRPKDYLDIIWKPDGQLIAPRSVDISDVNTVFPYYNSSAGVYELIIYQRVTGLFNADSLGYVITQQHLKDGEFVTFYDGLMVFSQ